MRLVRTDKRLPSVLSRMGSDVPETAPRGAQLLVDWGEEHADEVGVSSSEDQGVYEVNVTFGDASLMVAGTLGRGQPGLWDTVSLLRGRDIETNTAIRFPQQPTDAPPIVREEDELTLRTADAELSLAPRPEEGEAEG